MQSRKYMLTGENENVKTGAQKIIRDYVLTVIFYDDHLLNKLPPLRPMPNAWT